MCAGSQQCGMEPGMEGMGTRHHCIPAWNSESSEFEPGLPAAGSFEGLERLMLRWVGQGLSGGDSFYRGEILQTSCSRASGGRWTVGAERAGPSRRGSRWCFLLDVLSGWRGRLED